MLDRFKREIKYLRISLTDLCNFRCRYCMPFDGVCKKEHSDILTEEEILSIIKVAVTLGIKKIRLTGGEPLVKKNIISLVSKIRDIDGVDDICMTTNGSMLKQYAKDLKNAGLDYVNISLDTLDENKFKYITRCGELKNTLAGIDAALNVDFKRVKLNTVLIGGFNDDEIENFVNLTMKQKTDVRFIELMPMYDSGDFKKDAFIPCDIVLEKVKGLKEQYHKKGSVARIYMFDNALAHVGLISPLTNHFCNECNRIRLTSCGNLKPCLHSSKEIKLKGLNEIELKNAFMEAIYMKPEKHDILSYENRSKANRNMNEIGG